MSTPSTAASISDSAKAVARGCRSNHGPDRRLPNASPPASALSHCPALCRLSVVGARRCTTPRPQRQWRSMAPGGTRGSNADPDAPNGPCSAQGINARAETACRLPRLRAHPSGPRRRLGAWPPHIPAGRWSRRTNTRSNCWPGTSWAGSGLAHRQKGGAMKRERQQSTYEAGRRWPAPCLPSGCASFLLRVFAVKEGRGQG
jgi:hypothetical protein